MNRHFAEQVKGLMPVFLGETPQGPAIEPDGQLAFIDGFFKAGAPEFRFLYYLCIFSLKALSLPVKRKPFSRLTVMERQELAGRLLNTRNPLIRGTIVILGLPLYLSYYRREDVQVGLGFDRVAMKREADLHPVARDRGERSRVGSR